MINIILDLDKYMYYTMINTQHYNAFIRETYFIYYRMIGDLKFILVKN